MTLTDKVASYFKTLDINDMNITSLSPEVQKAIIWNDTITTVAVFTFLSITAVALLWYLSKEQ